VNLFGWAKTKRTYTEPQPATSRAAFESVDLAREAEQVLAVFRAFGARGCTADEIEDIRGHGHQRVVELRRKGCIIRTDRKRHTRSGRLAYIYVIATQS